MDAKALTEYAQKERESVTKFFSEFVGEFPKVRNGAENIVNPSLMVRVNLERIKASHKSSTFISSIKRLKWYRQYLETLKPINNEI